MPFTAKGTLAMHTLAGVRTLGPWSCFSTLDRGKVPQPVEDASEAAWREFDACWEALDEQVRELGPPLAAHEPRSLPARAVAAAGRQRPSPTPSLQVDDVMRLARINDRICPAAPAWRKLHQLLCILVQARRTDPAPAPVEPTRWAQTTDLQKGLCLRGQLAWAHHHGGLHVAHEFLRSLPEDDWDHHTPAAWPIL